MCCELVLSCSCFFIEMQIEYTNTYWRRDREDGNDDLLSQNLKCVNFDKLTFALIYIVFIHLFEFDISHTWQETSETRYKLIQLIKGLNDFFVAKKIVYDH